MVKLKKQLAEKEKALTEEQEAGVALQSKLKELRNELNAEKHQVRQLGETVAVRQAELSSLGGRLQLAAEEKQTLVQQIQQVSVSVPQGAILSLLIFLITSPVCRRHNFQLQFK